MTNPISFNSLPPLSRTYWVVEGKLLAGAYAGKLELAAHRARLAGLFDAGVRTFVNLMEEDESNSDGKRFTPYEETLQQIALDASDQINCVRFPIVDGQVTTQDRMTEILNAIDLSVQKNRPVYVHCFGGIGRTGTVVCCWLLRHNYANKENVFELLRTLRKVDKDRASWPAPENAIQRQFVLDWADNLSKVRRSQSKPSTTVVLRNDWFTELTGFSERSPDEVRDNIELRGTKIVSRVNGATYESGKLEIVSLLDLRNRVIATGGGAGKLKLEEVIGDSKSIHADPRNAGAVFQVASQFNLLEMISPNVTPEKGVAVYESDPTQGPACAIACGAGTIYRNYFVELEGQIGQSSTKQIDCLSDLGKTLGNSNSRLWKMQNGYALPSNDGLKEIATKLRRISEKELDELRGDLQIGVQWHTQVTINKCAHLVTQAYCSALPVAYSGLSSFDWEPFATLVLEAAYEATLAVAILNALQTGNDTVYLTSLGGGAFGNNPTWIMHALSRAISLYKDTRLTVRMVSYRQPNPLVSKLIATALKT